MEQPTLQITEEDCKRLGMRLPIVVSTGKRAWTVYAQDCDEAFARFLLLRPMTKLGMIVRFQCEYWPEPSLLALTEVMLKRVQSPDFVLRG